MTRRNPKGTKQRSTPEARLSADAYDPFARGRCPVGVRTIEAFDSGRDRRFPVEVWYPAASQHAGQDIAPETQDVFTDPLRNVPRSQMAVRDAVTRGGTYPLVLFSHSSGNDRRQSTSLCTHLASHGYVVAALDHSERIAAELSPKNGETDEQKATRWKAVIANRVPDIRFLLHHLLGAEWESEARIDPTRIGIAGHSFGGWTALAAIDTVRSIQAVVALAPAGASERRPGILPVELAFAWGRDVPTLYLVAEDDTSLPLAGMWELFERTPATKRMVILRRADHLHFMDDVEALHETVRTMPATGGLLRIQQQMRPVAELCPGEQANVFVGGLTLSHMDAALKQREEARRFWLGDIGMVLESRGVDAIAHRP